MREHITFEDEEGNERTIYEDYKIDRNNYENKRRQ